MILTLFLLLCLCIIFYYIYVLFIFVNLLCIFAKSIYRLMLSCVDISLLATYSSIDIDYAYNNDVSQVNKTKYKN